MKKKKKKKMEIKMKALWIVTLLAFQSESIFAQYSYNINCKEILKEYIVLSNKIATDEGYQKGCMIFTSAENQILCGASSIYNSGDKKNLEDIKERFDEYCDVVKRPN